MTPSDITVTNLFGSDNELPSSYRLRKIVNRIRTPWFFLTTTHANVSITPGALLRMAQVCRDTSATMVYADYTNAEGELIRTSDYHIGCVRDDFDMGPGVLIHTQSASKALSLRNENFEYAGLYNLRLRLSEIWGGIVRIPEPLSRIKKKKDDEASQFDYVDLCNANAQLDYERAFTAHLHRIGALCTSKPQTVEIEQAAWPVTASVIIPVKNRQRTIAAAIESALCQQTDFRYNILIVDNHSTDGTSEIIADYSRQYPEKVVHIVPRRTDLGIGGCWNEAISHRLCGAYSVQLDSDDRYSGNDTLQSIIAVFRNEKPAMVVGSYTLTDIDGNTIPPGTIDHREWTADNGRNNLLRVNGIGAPRAFVTSVAREICFPNTSYGEDYAMALQISRRFHISRIFTSLYQCRRWDGNSDAGLTNEKSRLFNQYKDTLRRFEIEARRRMNAKKR